MVWNILAILISWILIHYGNCFLLFSFEEIILRNIIWMGSYRNRSATVIDEVNSPRVYSTTEHDTITFHATETKFCWQSHSAAKTLVRFHWFICSYCCSLLASVHSQSALHNPGPRTTIMSMVWRVLDSVISDELSVCWQGLMWRSTFTCHRFVWSLRKNWICTIFMGLCTL